MSGFNEYVEQHNIARMAEQVEIEAEERRICPLTLAMAISEATKEAEGLQAAMPWAAVALYLAKQMEKRETGQ